MKAENQDNRSELWGAWEIGYPKTTGAKSAQKPQSRLEWTQERVN